ncbi:MAG: hypothetical protein FJX59_00440 [Alphaproteobacteria bacterium]|nr:hypothetical protein [Alphaproteobacteria bacterium]
MMFFKSMHMIRASLIALCCSLALAGCQSFGRGVTKALIDETRDEPQKHEELCEITGPGFQGLEAGFEGALTAGAKTVRLVIVHGIGEHQPGHSERFQRSLAYRLGLDGVDPQVKTIILQGPIRGGRFSSTPEALGTLRLARFTNGADRDLITFEVTWSSITQAERKSMDFDGVGAVARTRASLNATLKDFMNKRAADPLAYRGAKADAIRESVVQTICWATTVEWSGYPDLAEARCEWLATTPAIVARDTFAIASHSLGNRIAMDALEALGAAGDTKGSASNPTLTAFRDKSVDFYMLSNQLPLLQIGRPGPVVAHQARRYCDAGASNAADR